MSKPKIAFICVHNSCRSQIAEALGRHLSGCVNLSAEDAQTLYSILHKLLACF